MLKGNILKEAPCLNNKVRLQIFRQNSAMCTENSLISPTPNELRQGNFSACAQLHSRETVFSRLNEHISFCKRPNLSSIPEVVSALPSCTSFSCFSEVQATFWAQNQITKKGSSAINQSILLC